jgi:hypothetical protein
VDQNHGCVALRRQVSAVCVERKLLGLLFKRCGSGHNIPMTCFHRYISIVCCTYDRGQVTGSASVLHPPSPPLRTTTLRYLCAFEDGLPHGPAVLSPLKMWLLLPYTFRRLCWRVTELPNCRLTLSTRARGRGTTPSSPPFTTTALQCEYPHKQFSSFCFCSLFSRHARPLFPHQRRQRRRLEPIHRRRNSAARASLSLLHKRS